MTAATVAAWLLTYLLHSAVLLGAAWIGCALFGSRRLAAQETVLRAALLGGLATATLSLAVGAGEVSLTLATPDAVPSLPSVSRTELAATSAAAEAGLSTDARIAPRARAVPWSTLLLGLWVTGAGLGVTRLAVGSRRLRAILADRRPLPPGRLVRRLATALGLSRPVRLSLSRRIAVPFAVGFTRPEVCVPERTLDDLSPHQREALIAHELAHHARRDPAWLAVSRVVEAVLFVQPLNRLAVRRLQQLAECQCDDAAARTTGRPLDLARCLVEVAQWAAAPPEAVAALSSRTGLGRRVERLMAAASPQGPCSRWLAPCLAVAVASLGLVLPGVDLGAARPAAAKVGVQDPVDDPPPTPEPTPEAPAAAPRAPVPPRPAAAAPEARPAPPAPPDAKMERLEQELERLMERVSERVDRHRLELERLEGLIEALTARLEPHGEELERLGEELGRLAEQRLRELDDQIAPEQKAAMERQMRELEAQMREMVATFKPTTEEIARLAAEARALAEESRPSPEEMAEIERYAREMAERTRALAPTAEEARELAREAREEARAEAETHRAEIERQLREERQHARERALEEAEAERERAERDAERDRQRAEELERQAEERVREEAEPQPTPTPGNRGR